MPSNGYSWIECRSHENYPKIGLSFPSGDAKIVNQLLFDSGSDHSYLSSQIIDREGLDVDDFVLEEIEIRGRSHVIIEAELPVVLHDGLSTHKGQAWLVFVYDWVSSAWAAGCKRVGCVTGVQLCSERTGLISTRLLQDTGTKIALDGKSRTLSII